MQVENFTNFIMLTNEKAAFDHISASDRRVMAVECDSSKRSDHEYMKMLWGLCSCPHTARLFWRYLMHVSLEDFNPAKLPVTNLKKEMIQKNRSNEVAFVQYLACGSFAGLEETQTTTVS